MTNITIYLLLLRIYTRMLALKYFRDQKITAYNIFSESDGTNQSFLVFYVTHFASFFRTKNQKTRARPVV